MMVTKHVSEKGCRAPYLDKDTFYPKCNSTKDIKNAKLTYGKTKTIDCVKPCKRISRLMDNFNIGGIENLWKIQLTFPDEVKTIIMSKEVDIHTLIGNVGGYLGLLLGYAVFRLPTLFFLVGDKIVARA